MKPALKNLYDYFIINRTHRARRVPCEVDFATEYAALGLSFEERMCRRFEVLMAMEKPHILPGEQIVLTRTVSTFGYILTKEEEDALAAEHYIHGAYVNNLCPDYESTIREGFLAKSEGEKFAPKDSPERRPSAVAPVTFAWRKYIIAVPVPARQMPPKQFLRPASAFEKA